VCLCGELCGVVCVLCVCVVCGELCGVVCVWVYVC